VPRQIVLLRGVNLGARNRVSMAELRELLTGLGHEDVRTHRVAVVRETPRPAAGLGGAAW